MEGLAFLCCVEGLSVQKDFDQKYKGMLTVFSNVLTTYLGWILMVC